MVNIAARPGTDMDKKKIERQIVVVLFILVLVTFSFAERDSRKLDRLYKTVHLIQKSSPAVKDLSADAFRTGNSKK